MASGVTVGSVWLNVLPSMRDFGRQLTDQTQQASRNAGEQSGEALGEGTERGFRGRVAAIAAVGAGIGVAVSAAVSRSLDISAGRARLTAQLGLTADQSARYGRIAGQVYSQAYGESMQQVNEAIVAVHRNIGQLPDAELQQVTGTVLRLADVFEVELGAATTAVGQLMKTGLAPNARVALDVITAGFQAGVNRSEDFMDTLTEYSVQFAKFGLDAATATGILSQGMAAGARSSDLVADAIKEFSIRAVDGSELTAQGFAAVGLNAGQMAAAIAQGGPTAAAALDLTLDRLRAIPDPVQRSQAAVALFGTQAEDLGNALFALDPSTAVAALGQVAGAADRMNATVGETAQARLTRFQRTLEVAFVQILGGVVVPIIDSVVSVLSTVFGPVLDGLGIVVSTTVIPALTGLATWLRDSAAWLVPLAVGIGTFVLALNAATIATTLWGFATTAATTIMGIARGAVLSFRVAIWLLNLAMAANPIGFIVAALVGLVAGLITAYQTSETFRNIVQGAWRAIQTAASFAWNSIIKPIFTALGIAAGVVGGLLVGAFNGIVVAFRAVATAATWLWSVVLQPVFNFIGLAARVLLAVIVTAVATPIVLALQGIGAAASWLWTAAIQPSFTAIRNFLGTVWNFIRDVIFTPIVNFLRVTLGPSFNVLRDVAVNSWNAIRTGINIVWTFLRNIIFIPLGNFLRVTLGASFNFLRDVAINAWNMIRNGINVVWTFLRNVIFVPIVNFLRVTLGTSFNVLRDVAIGAWNSIRDGLNVVWGFIRDRIWQPLVNFVTVTIPGAFDRAVGFIRGAWAAVRDAVRAPIEAVINVVYNRGIVPVWNWVAGLVGLDPLREYHLPGFASGGPVQGGIPGKDSVLLAAMPGEYMLSREAVQAAGGVGAVEGMHRMLRSGNLPGALGIPGFQQGGAVESHESGGFSLGGLWEAVVGGIQRLNTMFASTRWGQMAIGLVKKLTDSLWPALLDKVTGWFTSLFGFGGGEAGGTAVPAGPVRDVVQRTAAQFGWGSGPQWDALVWIINHESGWRPNAQNPTSTAYGLFQFLDGTWAGTGISKTSDPALQALAGMRYISNRYGSPLGARSFWQANGWYDDGGMLPTGWSTVFNGTGKPETVLNDRQWRALVEGSRGGDGAVEARLGQLVEVLAARPPTEITVEDRSGSPVETARATQLALRLSR